MIHRLLLILLTAALAACSIEGAINAMTSPEDRQLAQDFVRNVRTGNEAWLRERFDPQDPALWERSVGQLRAVAGQFPDEGGTRLIGYQFSTTSGTEGTQRSKTFTLVSDVGGRWFVTSFQTFSNGGPDRIVAWSVTPHDSAPPELAMVEASERMVPWLRGLGVGFLLVVVGIVVAFVRYRRRRRAGVTR